MGSTHFVPRLPLGLLSRPRVEERMPGRQPRALTVVHAAAGMGKSVALAQWASSDAGDYSIVWMSLSPSTAGRFAFWRFVIDRLRESGAAGPAENLLADIAPASPVAHTLRESLRRALATLPAPLVIVLDDLHTVRDAEVDDDLVWLLAHLPRLSVVVGTRETASLTSALARSQIEVAVIDQDALAMTPAEVAELTQGAGLPDTSSRALYAATRGWPMLVQAELLERTEGGRVGVGRHRSLGAAVNRIVRSAIEAGSAQQVRFILRTSLAEEVPVALGVALTGESETEVSAIFADLESRSLGTMQFEHGREVFRYHPLLRTEFERALEAEPEDVAPIRHALALWLSEHGRPIDAAAQAVRIEDWELLNAVRSRHGSTLTMTHPMTYLEILRTIPDDVMVRYPGLQLSRSLLSVRRDRRVPATIRQIGGALATLAAARYVKDATRSELGRLWNQGILMILHRLNGRADASASAAEEVARILSSLSAADRDDAGSYVALVNSHIAITCLHLGNPTDALHYAQLDLEAAEQYANEWEAVHAIALTCWSLAVQGNMVAAERWLQRARATTRPDGWQDSYAGTGYRLAEAMVALERFDAEAAEQHVRALDFHAPTIEHWPFILQVEGMIALTRGTTIHGARTIAAVAGARRRRPKFPHVDRLVAATRATLDIALGDSASAHAIDQADPASPVARLAMARVALIDGNYERALMLSHLPDDADPAEVRLAASSLVISSLAALKLGAEESGVESLRSAFALMQRYGMRQPLMLVPRALLLEAVEAVRARQGVELDVSDVPDRFRISRSVAALTRRELVVLNELTRSSNLDSIAQELVVSRNTIKGQISSLYRKLGVTNRADALVVAVELGLVSPA